jgi:hypothetical protein
MARVVQKQAHGLDSILAGLAALAIIGVVLFLAVRNTPIADPNLVVALRTLLSLGAAILGAAIPGFLNVGWTARGLTIRAGGALALFVLTFVYTPEVVRPIAPNPPAPVVSAPNGVAVGGNVEGSVITVQPGASPATR